MSARKELLALLEKDNLSPSIGYWTDLLNLFEKCDKDKFDLETMRILCDESERCRAYWNKPRLKRVAFMKGMDDEPQYTDVEEKGLEISKGDVYPRIYDYLAELELREKLTQLKEEQSRNKPVELNRQLVPAII